MHTISGIWNESVFEWDTSKEHWILLLREVGGGWDHFE